jgi:uncharacterized membrane protein (DUF485 family)
MPFRGHFRHEPDLDGRKSECLGILATGITNTKQGIHVPLGTIIGVSMIAAGFLLLGVVVWKSVTYRQNQRNLQRNFDD